METGTVKFFNQEKGYGFITPDSGSKDVFVHITGVTGEPIGEGDTVDFEMGDGPKGPCAVNVVKK